MGKHERTVSFTTRCSRLANLEMIMFIKDSALRSHMVKHLFSKAEVRQWKMHVALDGIDQTVENLITELNCPYFGPRKAQGIPPCEWCDEFGNGCESYLGDWDRLYVQVLEAVIDKAIKEPVWIYSKGPDRDSGSKDRIFLDFFSPESGVRVCAILFDKDENRYVRGNTSMVVTAYASRLSLEEVMASINKQARESVPCLPLAKGLTWQETLHRMKRELT